MVVEREVPTQGEVSLAEPDSSRKWSSQVMQNTPRVAQECGRYYKSVTKALIE